MPQNSAAWISANKARPLQVKSAPYTPPEPNQVVIRNYAVAINPVDWMMQELGTSLTYNWIKFPFIFGVDVAGEVVEVGARVTRFKVGDRVIAEAVGQDQKRNKASECAFQQYVVLLEHMTAPIPDSVSYESAVVLPLGVATAACGMFQKDQLNLNLPSANPLTTGKTLIVWGGSSSVGSNAIQLAVAAGYEVFTTASPKNFEYVKKLGAARVFDYNTKTVVADIVQAFKGRTTAGALIMGANGSDACMDILDKVPGDKFISIATYPVPSPPPKRFPILKTMFAFFNWSVAYWFKSKARGIKFNFIFATTLVENGVGKAIFGDYLGPALLENRYQVAPESVVVGKGLKAIQDAMDYQRNGVSAKKVVVSLAE